MSPSLRQAKRSDDKSEASEKELKLQQIIRTAVGDGWKPTAKGKQNIDHIRVYEHSDQVFFFFNERDSFYCVESLRSMIFYKDFARTVWGNDKVDSNGFNMTLIEMWARQVAVEHMGRLYAVESQKPIVTFYETPEMKTLANEYAELAIPDIQRVEYKLEHMSGTIPFRTHRIERIDVVGDVQPAYDYHRQRMVIADDPLQYLIDNAPEVSSATELQANTKPESELAP